MYKPKYQITNQLLTNITKINEIVLLLNNRRFPRLVLMELEDSARTLSTYASTSIEGNPLPLTEIKKVLKAQPRIARTSEQEVLNYNQALNVLNQQLESGQLELSKTLVLTVHKLVTKSLLPKFESGKFRQKPVVVNDPKTRRVVFLPPDHQDVDSLMTDLIEFVKNNHQTINPLIVAGIFHKQMLIIHPFMDGNGRTTRLATKMLLARMGLNTFNLFSFENYYNQNVTKYFQMVGEFGDYNDLKLQIDFTDWLEYFTAGIIDELLRVQKMLLQNGNSPDTKLASHHLKILKQIREHGFITDRDYAQLTTRAKATRVIDFNQLIDLGMIKRLGKGKTTHYVLS